MERLPQLLVVLLLIPVQVHRSDSASSGSGLERLSQQVQMLPALKPDFFGLMVRMPQKAGKQGPREGLFFGERLSPTRAWPRSTDRTPLVRRRPRGLWHP